MTGDRLDDLRAALNELDSQPVDAHPVVLDAVHRALVDELDALAATVAAEREAARRV